MKRLAENLGCKPTEIDPNFGQARLPKQTGARSGGTIPIRSGDTVVGYVQRSGSLTGVPDAYALYMVGNEMEPRYKQGWLLQVNPFKPPSRGRDVVVRKVGGSTVVAEFIEQIGGELVLMRLNPAEEIRISLGDVQDVHLIVLSDQEGG